MVKQVIEINVQRNDTHIQTRIPIEYLPHLKVSKTFHFLKRKEAEFLQHIVSSIKEEALGLQIDVESEETHILVEVKEYVS